MDVAPVLLRRTLVGHMGAPVAAAGFRVLSGAYSQEGERFEHTLYETVFALFAFSFAPEFHGGEPAFFFLREATVLEEKRFGGEGEAYSSGCSLAGLLGEGWVRMFVNS